MFCGNCGKQIENDVSMCPFCGDVLCNNSSGSINKNKYNKLFIDTNEELIATLGDGYLVNALNREIASCNALLTDKRIYLQGMLFQNGKKGNTEKIVEVEDVTETGFKQNDNIAMLVCSVLCISSGIIGMFYATGFICILLLGIVLLASYFKNRSTLFVIEYAGGRIQFNASILGLDTVRDFQRQIHRVKDNVRKKK